MDIREATDRAQKLLQRLPSGDELSFDAQGVCALQSEGAPDLFLEIMPEEEILVLSTPLLEVAPKELPTVAVRALALNLYQIATGGGVLALDPQSEALVFSQNISLHADDIDLGAVMSAHIDTALALTADFIVSSFADAVDEPAAGKDEQDMVIIR